MKYKIVLSDDFKKHSKHLLKKYPSLKQELYFLGKELEENPTFGIHLGDNIYKIRSAIASKGRGKSGGARIITYIVVDEATILLLTIYSKGEKDSISDKEIKALIKKYIP